MVNRCAPEIRDRFMDITFSEVIFANGEIGKASHNWILCAEGKPCCTLSSDIEEKYVAIALGHETIHHVLYKEHIWEDVYINQKESKPHALLCQLAYEGEA